MSRKLCGFQSRKIAAFLTGLLTGILIGGCCSVFGPGVGVSVYRPSDKALLTPCRASPDGPEAVR